MKKTLLLASLFLLVCFFTAQAQQKTIKGKVIDNNGDPVPAATIVISGTTNGTTADAEGQFTLQMKEGEKLEVSSVGYKKKIVLVSSGQSSITITLQANAHQLNETVVTALGISKKERSLGYAVSTVDGDAITRTQSPDFATALYGKVPGMRVSSAPGGATSGAFFQVRGLGSITGNTQPLIVLDGIPIRNGQVDNTGYFSDQRIRGNGLVDINPEDIKSISVLKGASAAALYGSEAANGVILITTKNGKRNGFNVSFNASYSQSKIAYLPKLQSEYGPGYSTQLSDAGQDEDGWVYQTVDDQKIRTPIGTRINYGPKFDGKPTLAWTGDITPYKAQPNHFSGFSQTPKSSVVSLKITNVTDKANVRFDFTRQDNTMLSLGSKNHKNIVNFNTDFRLSKYYQTSLMINYINKLKFRRRLTY